MPAENLPANAPPPEPAPGSGMPPEPDWASWQPTVIATLVFVRRGDEVLLIEKKRGFGKDKVNGPGGKLEPGETLVSSAIRETWEEVGLRVRGLSRAAELRFEFTDGLRIHCHVFVTTEFEGEPVETAEARPFWCGIEEIPYERAWADDRYWLPQVLAGECVDGRFGFDGEEMTWMKLAPLANLD